MFGINSSNENININNEESNMDNINVDHATSDVAWRMIVTNLRAERDSWEQRFHALQKDCDGMSLRMTQMEQHYKRECDEYERRIADLKRAGTDETVKLMEVERRYNALNADFDGAMRKIDTLKKENSDLHRQVEAVKVDIVHAARYRGQQVLIDAYRTSLCDEDYDNLAEINDYDKKRTISINGVEFDVDNGESLRDALITWAENATANEDFDVEYEYDPEQRKRYLASHDLLSVLKYLQTRIDNGADVCDDMYADSMALLKHDVIDAITVMEQNEIEVWED